MSEYGATVAWHLQRGTEFDYEHFNRDHEWTFAGGEVVQASGSPAFYGPSLLQISPCRPCTPCRSAWLPVWV